MTIQWDGASILEGSVSRVSPFDACASQITVGCQPRRFGHREPAAWTVTRPARRLARHVRPVLDAVHPHEVGVLGPKRRVMTTGRCEDDGIHQGKSVPRSEQGRFDGIFGTQVDDVTSSHEGNRRHRRILASLLMQPPEHLIQGDGGHDEQVGFLDGFREEPCIRRVGEVRQPRLGIDDVHTRSSSRGTVVSMPAAKPRMEGASDCGTNTI